MQNIFLSANAKVGIVFAGKARIRHVLRGRRRAYGNIDVLAVFFLHLAICVDYLCFKRSRELRRDYSFSYRRTHLLEMLDVVFLEAFERCLDEIFKTSFAKEQAVTLRRYDES